MVYLLIICRAVARFARQTRCVALSGGVDSVVLLHLFAQAQSSLQLASLSALHIHHGLNAQADQWQAFCADYASRLHIPFTAQSVRIQTNGLGIEAAARQARYQIFAQQNADFIALAHHKTTKLKRFGLLHCAVAAYAPCLPCPKCAICHAKIVQAA